MRLGILSAFGVLIAVVGAAMMLFPRPLGFVLRVLGVRWEPHEASRVAAWCLVGIGLVVVVLARVVR